MSSHHCANGVALCNAYQGLLFQGFRWSSYHHNAMDKADSMLSPHPLHQALRKATKDCRIVGSDKFQTEIAAVLTRRVKKYADGEDRRSERSKQVTG